MEKPDQTDREEALRIADAAQALAARAAYANLPDLAFVLRMAALEAAQAAAGGEIAVRAGDVRARLN